MEWRDRNGRFVSEGDEENKSLSFLYETGFGRLLLRLIITKPVSAAAGWLLQRRISALWVKSFIEKNNIDMSEYESRKFRSFNDFFTRKILPGCRRVDENPEHFISPCDCKLTVFDIRKEWTIITATATPTAASRNKMCIFRGFITPLIP